jgi:hypothetical protein
LIVVQGDPVQGTDRHKVKGDATNPAPPPPTVTYVGVASFEYDGAITDLVSDFVTIDGTPVAVVTSHSTLNAGETGASGHHAGPAGSSFLPSAPVPIPSSISIVDSPIGTGVPGPGAGSGLLTVAGAKPLLDGDAIDTCGVPGGVGAATVTASGQDFVSCSA